MRKQTDRLFGGIEMTWLRVIIFAVCSAVVTAVFLIVPFFAERSFGRMGVYLEAWILLAVIIMSNCKKPLESALKVFVFFLISQPLIYLFQVPFSWMGWGVFRFYPYWFVWTLITFPMAYFGWYINRKDWLSALIFLPVIGFLGMTAYSLIRDIIGGESNHVLAAVFCIAQILIYIYTFFPRPSALTGKEKTAAIVSLIAGFAVPLIAAGVIGLKSKEIGLMTARQLPEMKSLSSEATVRVEDESVAEIRLTIPEEAIVGITVHKYGSTIFTVTDGDSIYAFLLNVKDGGNEVIIEIYPADMYESG